MLPKEYSWYRWRGAALNNQAGHPDLAAFSVNCPRRAPLQQNDEMQEQFKRFSSKEACSTGAEHAESMKPPHSSDSHDDPYGRFSTSGKSGRTSHSARGDGPYSHSSGFEKFGLDSPDEYRGYDLKRAGIYSIAKLDPSASDDARLNWHYQFQSQLTRLKLDMVYAKGVNSRDDTSFTGPKANADLFTILLDTVSDSSAIITDVRNRFPLHHGRGDGHALGEYLHRHYVPGARGDLTLGVIKAESEWLSFDWSRLASPNVDAASIQRILNEYILLNHRAVAFFP